MNYKENSKKQEVQILKFLRKMGFKHVNGGDNFFIGGKQVDACAGHEHTLLILECTTQKDINGKITEFRGKMKDINYGFKKDETYKTYKHYKYILVVKHQKVTKSNLKFALETKGNKVYIWDNNFVNYYSKLVNTIKEFAKYNLLAEIDVKPDKFDTITVPAFCLGIGPKARDKLFLFFIEAKKLMKFSYVARRELGNESFYQRMIQKKRLTEIADYIRREKDKIFPNSIIIALDDHSWNFTPIPKEQFFSKEIDLSSKIEIGELTLYNNYRSCWIIDGQHRLYSYAYSTKPGNLVVSAFAKLRKERQADYFLDINKEAKRVDPNLLWDLLGTLSPNSTRGIISNVVKELCNMNKGFFEKNIKIPSMCSGKFNFNNLCVSFEKNVLAEKNLTYPYQKKKNPYWNKDYNKFKKDISSGINQFFCCIDDGLDEDKKEVYTDGFVSVMITLFKVIVIHLKGKKPSLDEEKEIISPLLESINTRKHEDIERVRKQLSSEGGKKDFLDDIIRLIQHEYDQNFALGLVKKELSLAEKINNLELLLNKFVNFILEKEIGPDWVNNSKYFTDGEQRKKCLEKSERHGRPPWEFINFLTTVLTIIMNNELWGRFFKNIFIERDGFSSKLEMEVCAKKLWDYRSNKIGHPKSSSIIYSRDQENLIQSMYNIFLSIIKENMQG